MSDYVVSLLFCKLSKFIYLKLIITANCSLEIVEWLRSCCCWRATNLVIERVNYWNQIGPKWLCFSRARFPTEPWPEFIKIRIEPGELLFEGGGSNNYYYCRPLRVVVITKEKLISPMGTMCEQERRGLVVSPTAPLRKPQSNRKEPSIFSSRKQQQQQYL